MFRLRRGPMRGAIADTVNGLTSESEKAVARSGGIPNRCVRNRPPLDLIPGIQLLRG